MWNIVFCDCVAAGGVHYNYNLGPQNIGGGGGAAGTARAVPALY